MEWIGLIAGGAVIAGTAAVVYMGMNGLVKENSGS